MHTYALVHAPTHTFTYTLAWQGRNQPTESEIGGDNRRDQWVVDRLPKGAACTQPTGRARKEHAISNSGDRGTEAWSWFSSLAAGGAQKAGEFRCIVNFYAHTNCCAGARMSIILATCMSSASLLDLYGAISNCFPHRRRIWTNSRSCAMTTQALKPSMRSLRPVLMMCFVSAMQRFASDVFKHSSAVIIK